LENNLPSCKIVVPLPTGLEFRFGSAKFLAKLLIRLDDLSMFVEQGHIAIYKQLNNLLMELSAEVAMDQQIRFG
jgi:hypothetical protein